MAIETRPSRVPWPRRRILQTGIAGALTLGLGALLATHQSGYAPLADAAALRALSLKEYRIVEAVAARIVRADARDLPTAASVGVARFVDGLVARMAAAERLDLTRLLHVVEHVLPLASGHTRRFSALTGTAQDQVLELMMTSPIGILRGAFDALKSLCLMGYFQDSRTFAALGYDGPWQGRPPGGFGARG